VKKVVLFFYLVFLFGGNTFLCAEEIVKSDQLYQEIVVETLDPYFTALKNGDVESLKSLLSGKLYKRYKVLLEKNDAYPEFLQNHFRDTTFQIEKIVTSGDDVLIDVVIEFPGNQPLKSKYLLRREDGPTVGSKGWKLVEQIN